MAYIYEQTKNGHRYYYLKEKRGNKPLYLGTKPPIAKSRGWTNLSPKIVAWLKERAQQKTKPVKTLPEQKGKYRTIVPRRSVPEMKPTGSKSLYSNF